jgi:hypothetical protein
MQGAYQARPHQSGSKSLFLQRFFGRQGVRSRNGTQDE